MPQAQTTPLTGSPRLTKIDYLNSWRADFKVFAHECVKIHAQDPVLKQGSKVLPLTLNPAQELIYDQWAKKQSKARIIVLKARQVGSSTFCVLLFLWMCLFIPGRRIAIVAQRASSAKTILKMAAFAMQHLPTWVQQHPNFKCKISSTQINFANGSLLQTGTANSNFWLGGTYDAVLLTEATSYDSLEETMSAILPACTGPCFMESTAHGMGLFKDVWDDPNSAWEKVFISWLIDQKAVADHTDQVPTAEDQAYIDAWGLTQQQANWYLTQKWTTYAGNQRRFDQEAPASPEMAFIVAGNKFFAGRHFQFNPKDMPKDARVDWEEPQKDHKYILGIDVAMGSTEGDASAAVLLDVTDPKQIKVACTLQCWEPTPLYSDDLIQIIKDYGNVLSVVESNIGADVIRTLKRHKCKQYTRQRIADKFEEQVEEYGFATTAQSRPMLMAALTRYVMGNIIVDLNDPRLKAEANNFIYNKDGKPEAASGKHDDLIMALALALIGLDQMYMLKTAPKKDPPPPRPPGVQGIQWDMRFGPLKYQNK